jgi:hypothetical protein
MKEWPAEWQRMPQRVYGSTLAWIRERARLGLAKKEGGGGGVAGGEEEEAEAAAAAVAALGTVSDSGGWAADDAAAEAMKLPPLPTAAANRVTR